MTVKQLTESAMARHFEEFLRSKRPANALPHFNLILKEVICKQGIPDFIATTGTKPRKEYLKIIHNVFHASTESSAKVLAVLKYAAPRTEDYVMRTSGLSRRTVKRIIRKLVNKGIAVKKYNTYLLSPKWKLGPMEFWAFELKLNDWKRALFQALQYKAFADRVIIVFPSNKEKILRHNIEKFKKLKVGVMIFDLESKMFEILLQPMKSGPLSRDHRFFAFSKVH